MDDFLYTTKNIYYHLQDEKSKFLFENRVLYTLTGDSRYIERIIEQMPQKQALDQAIAFCRNHIHELVVYGAGNDLSLLTELYPDAWFRYICDGSRQKQENGWRGIPVWSPEELIKKKDKVYVAVNTAGFHKEIVQFLLANGVHEEKIIDLGAISAPLYSEQYFDKEVMAAKPEEVFIDGGCFDCATDKRFIEWCSGSYRKIYAFEPDAENYRRCKEICEREMMRNVEIYKRGLWDCETELSFQETGGQGSKLGEGKNTVLTAVIDRVAGDEPVSLIKLDVEGAELEALKGARETIVKNHPRLAISIYHKPEDIFTIPEYILSLHQDYRFYIRHYQMSPCETILYAL